MYFDLANLDRRLGYPASHQRIKSYVEAQEHQVYTPRQPSLSPMVHSQDRILAQPSLSPMVHSQDSILAESQRSNIGCGITPHDGETGLYTKLSWRRAPGVAAAMKGKAKLHKPQSGLAFTEEELEEKRAHRRQHRRERKFVVEDCFKDASASQDDSAEPPRKRRKLIVVDRSKCLSTRREDIQAEPPKKRRKLDSLDRTRSALALLSHITPKTSTKMTQGRLTMQPSLGIFARGAFSANPDKKERSNKLTRRSSNALSDVSVSRDEQMLSSSQEKQPAEPISSTGPAPYQDHSENIWQAQFSRLNVTSETSLQRKQSNWKGPAWYTIEGVQSEDPLECRGDLPWITDTTLRMGITDPSQSNDDEYDGSKGAGRVKRDQLWADSDQSVMPLVDLHAIVSKIQQQRSTLSARVDILPCKDEAKVVHQVTDNANSFLHPISSGSCFNHPSNDQSTPHPEALEKPPRIPFSDNPHQPKQQTSSAKRPSSVADLMTRTQSISSLSTDELDMFRSSLHTDSEELEGDWRDCSFGEESKPFCYASNLDQDGVSSLGAQRIDSTRVFGYHPRVLANMFVKRQGSTSSSSVDPLDCFRSGSSSRCGS
ncbi:unnamed protein product [Sympodiomycopsis kandeliae]